MGLFVAILFCLLVGTCFGQSTNKHMICKSVDDVFDDVTTTGVARRRNIGPPGKPGFPGISGDRGLPGLKGQAGEVDYSRLEKIVRARVSEETRGLEARVDEMDLKMENMTRFMSETRDLESRVDEMDAKIENMTRFMSETRDLESRVDEMDAKIQNVTQTISETRRMEIKLNKVNDQLLNMTEKVDQVNARFQSINTPAMCDGVIYNWRCFWAEIHSTRDTNIAKAQEICKKRGSRLADIYSKTHNDLVFEYLRSKLDGKSEIFVWTGMRKIYGNRNAQLSNNTQAPYTKASSSSSEWNTASRDRTHVYLKVRDPSYSGTERGMKACSPTCIFHGALCQSQ